MRYACLGTQIVNEIHFADGSEKTGIMGGTVFALAGLQQYCADSILFADRGSDWEQYFGKWFRDNGISEAGLDPIVQRQTFSELHYLPTGEWKEDMFFGPADRAAENLRLTEQMLSAVTGETRGIYLYESIYNDAFWKLVAEKLPGSGPKRILELITAECVAENLKPFREKILPLVDIYSLNRTEAYPFFGVSTEQEAVEQIIKLGKPCYFRCGKRGAYMIMDGRAVFVPSFTVRRPEDEIDPTGCGNCSTAAALYGFAEGYGAEETGAIASLAAAYNVMQYGPNPVFTAQTRADSLAWALRESKNYMQQKGDGLQ